MSERNVELHRSLVAAFNAHDIEAFIVHFDPRGEFESVFSAVGGAVYRGHDELLTYFRELMEAWDDDLRLAPNAYFEHDENTLLEHVIHARGRHSGAEVTRPVTHLCRCRDGLLVHTRTCARIEDALSDLSVSEDELERIAP